MTCMPGARASSSRFAFPPEKQEWEKRAPVRPSNEAPRRDNQSQARGAEAGTSPKMTPMEFARTVGEKVRRIPEILTSDKLSATEKHDFAARFVRKMEPTPEDCVVCIRPELSVGQTVQDIKVPQQSKVRTSNRAGSRISSLDGRRRSLRGKVSTDLSQPVKRYSGVVYAVTT
jgi:hypothetical protein